MTTLHELTDSAPEGFQNYRLSYGSVAAMIWLLNNEADKIETVIWERQDSLSESDVESLQAAQEKFAQAVSELSSQIDFASAT